MATASSSATISRRPSLSTRNDDSRPGSSTRIVAATATTSSRAFTPATR